MDERWWYVSFGIGQLLRKYYVKIFDTYESARARVFKQFGSCWCCIYSEQDWQKALDRGSFKDLSEICIPTKKGEDVDVL